MTTATKFFAAYDANAIHAVATRPYDAIENAEDAGLCASSLKTAEISEALFNQIERRGWDGRSQSFEVRNGELFDTTNE